MLSSFYIYKIITLLWNFSLICRENGVIKKGYLMQLAAGKAKINSRSHCLHSLSILTNKNKNKNFHSINYYDTSIRKFGNYSQLVNQHIGSSF